MSRLSQQEAELLAEKFRLQEAGVSLTEPIAVNTLLRKLRIMTMFRPMSENSYGISCKSKSHAMFMLVNSNSTLGRQHFTIGHELYHLYYDKVPIPHVCGGAALGSEKEANLFSSALLMPQKGILPMISGDEIKAHEVKLSTVLRMEQLFEVSRITLLLRLKDIGLITKKQFEQLRAVSVKDSAREYGYGLSLYEPGNKGMVIGDFGEKARTLFEDEKISEGHYIELLNMISDDNE